LISLFLQIFNFIVSGVALQLQYRNDGPVDHAQDSSQPYLLQQALYLIVATLPLVVVLS
jgi:hypothetical protein